MRHWLYRSQECKLGDVKSENIIHHTMCNTYNEMTQRGKSIVPWRWWAVLRAPGRPAGWSPTALLPVAGPPPAPSRRHLLLRPPPVGAPPGHRSPCPSQGALNPGSSLLSPAAARRTEEGETGLQKTISPSQAHFLHSFITPRWEKGKTEVPEHRAAFPAKCIPEAQRADSPANVVSNTAKLAVRVWGEG